MMSEMMAFVYGALFTVGVMFLLVILMAIMRGAFSSDRKRIEEVNEHGEREK